MNEEIRINIFTKDIFFTPDVHKIMNSLSCKCLNIKIVKDTRNAKGINFIDMPRRFSKEYLK